MQASYKITVPQTCREINLQQLCSLSHIIDYNGLLAAGKTPAASADRLMLQSMSDLLGVPHADIPASALQQVRDGIARLSFDVGQQWEEILNSNYATQMLTVDGNEHLSAEDRTEEIATQFFFAPADFNEFPIGVWINVTNVFFAAFSQHAETAPHKIFRLLPYLLARIYVERDGSLLQQHGNEKEIDYAGIQLRQQVLLDVNARQAIAALNYVLKKKLQ